MSDDVAINEALAATRLHGALMDYIAFHDRPGWLTPRVKVALAEQLLDSVGEVVAAKVEARSAA